MFPCENNVHMLIKPIAILSFRKNVIISLREKMLISMAQKNLCDGLLVFQYILQSSWQRNIPMLRSFCTF